MEQTATVIHKQVKYSIFEKFKELRTLSSTRYAPVMRSDEAGNKDGLQEGSISTEEKEWFRAENIPEESIAFVRQKHGANVINVTEPGKQGQCDGLITCRTDLFLRIATADCLPVFLYDPVRKAIGLVHAGWRGLDSEIVPKAIGEMTSNFDTNPQDLQVAVGPFIQNCCYSVKNDVASLFKGEFYASDGNGNVMLDMGKIIRHQLSAVGILEDNIEITNECTYCNKKLYYSARRDGKKSGRNSSIMCLAESTNQEPNR